MTWVDILFYVGIFIVSYVVLYLAVQWLFPDMVGFSLLMSRAVDFFMLILFAVICFSIYYSVPSGGSSQWVASLNSSLASFFTNPWSLLTIGLGLFALYTFVYLFRIPMESGLKPWSIAILENFGIFAFVIVAIETVVKLLFKVDLVAGFINFLVETFPSIFPSSSSISKTDSDTDSDSGSGSGTGITPLSVSSASSTTNPPSSTTNPPSSNSSVNTPTTPAVTKKPTDGKEVFNIATNAFTYQDAPAVCAAVGAQLATYDQIEAAYEDGAEWCNYGWSADQMAFFPTQKDTWKTLQANGQGNNCGRPGVNGGYMENPNLTFGVNCYGVKPGMTPEDKLLMSSQAALVSGQVPLNATDAAFQQKVQYFQSNAAHLLNINGFNENKWSEIS
jgi:hypothetical protein